MIYNNRNLTISDYLVRNFLTFETNQDAVNSTFASDYLTELINQYFLVLKKNKEVIEKVLPT